MRAKEIEGKIVAHVVQRRRTNFGEPVYVVESIVFTDGSLVNFMAEECESGDVPFVTAQAYKGARVFKDTKTEVRTVPGVFLGTPGAIAMVAVDDPLAWVGREVEIDLGRGEREWVTILRIPDSFNGPSKLSFVVRTADGHALKCTWGRVLNVKEP